MLGRAFSFYRNKDGKLHLTDGFCPVSIKDAKELLDLLNEYIQTSDPDAIEEERQHICWQEAMRIRSSPVRDYANDGMGFVFVTKKNGSIRVFHTRRDGDKKRDELLRKGCRILHVYESNHARKLAIWLDSWLSDAEIYFNLDEDWIVQQLIHENFPDYIKALID